jgi:hypothetical protein
VGHNGFTLLFHNADITVKDLTCEKTPEGTKVTVPAGCLNAVFAVV